MNLKEKFMLIYILSKSLIRRLLQVSHLYAKYFLNKLT